MFQVSYLLEPTESDGTDEYYGGSGTVFDIAYRFEAGSFSFGPQLTQASFTYKKHKTLGVETDIDFTYTHLLPMLGFWLNF